MYLWKGTQNTKGGGLLKLYHPSWSLAHTNSTYRVGHLNSAQKIDIVTLLKNRYKQASCMLSYLEGLCTHLLCRLHSNRLFLERYANGYHPLPPVVVAAAPKFFFMVQKPPAEQKGEQETNARRL